MRTVGFYCRALAKVPPVVFPPGTQGEVIKPRFDESKFGIVENTENSPPESSRRGVDWGANDRAERARIV